MTQPNSLKPCPFCGGEGRWNWNHDYILCGSCDIAVRPAAWDTRPAATDGSALREAFAWRFEKGRLVHIGNLSDGECRALAALRANLSADGGTHSADNGGSK